MLKKWNFRKNLTEEEWAILGNKVQKRKREGKDSEVVLGVTHISKKRLKKGLNRYASSILKVPRSMISFIP